MNCANEQYGVIENDSVIIAHLERQTPTGIYQCCLDILRRAEQSGRTPAEEAELLADQLSLELHPIWGNRGQVIMDFLVQSNWVESAIS